MGLHSPPCLCQRTWSTKDQFKYTYFLFQEFPNVSIVCVELAAEGAEDELIKVKS